MRRLKLSSPSQTQALHVWTRPATSPRALRISLWWRTRRLLAHWPSSKHHSAA
ncbi:unnamed protein product, partial [Ranitomeya imitator]